MIGQRLANGQWVILDELCTQDTGIVRFAEQLVAHVAQRFPSYEVQGFGDPAGLARAQTDERTVFDIMRARTPWKWRPAPSNDVQMRLEVVRNALSRLIDGRPGLVVSPKCATLRRALAGGYRYKQTRTGSGISVAESPDKNEFSHIADALGYALSGGGEVSVVLMRNQRTGNENLPQFADLDYPTFTT